MRVDVDVTVSVVGVLRRECWSAQWPGEAE